MWFKMLLCHVYFDHKCVCDKHNATSLTGSSTNKSRHCPIDNLVLIRNVCVITMQRAVIDQVHLEPTHLHHPAVTSQLTSLVTCARSPVTGS